MSIATIMKSKGSTSEEVFTLDEGRVMISYPSQLSGASLQDLKQYLDIFYRKAARLTDDPVDLVDPKLFDRKKILAAQ